MLIAGVSPIQINNHHVYIFDDTETLAVSSAEFITNQLTDIAKTQSQVSFALSGGSTPVHIYQQLVKSPQLEKLPWDKLQIYFGDERYVPHDDEQSNYKMAVRAFLDQAPLQSSQVFAVPTDCDEPQLCASHYAQTIQKNLGDKPVLDFALLGMGDDGHTASLFPGTTILTESTTPAAAVYVEKFKSWRISMTYPVFNQARCVSILVAGEGKAEVLSQVLNEPDAGYPVQGIQNPHGTIWLVDQAAASKLTS